MVEYVMIEDREANTVFAQGEVIDEVERHGEKLISLDKRYYLYKGGCKKYKTAFKPKEILGNPVEFRTVPGYEFADLDSDNTTADVFINLSKDETDMITSEVVKVIDSYKGIKVCKADFDESVIVFEGDCEENFDRLKNILIYVPSGLPAICTVATDGLKCTISINGNKVERFENLHTMKNYLNTLIENGLFVHTPDELTYMNNMGKKSYQWELWAMCNNLCKYCYLGQTNRGTNKERQLKSLRDCYKNICNIDFNIYNNISFIGGEFFQGQLDDPEVHDEFMKLMRKCAEYYREGHLGSIWITVTLTLGDQKHLYEMLEIFKEYECFPREGWGATGIWLCTSWDIEGRFHTPERLANWEYHMKNLTENYPWVKKNCTIILMEKFLQAYIDGEWSLKRFMSEYNTSLFFKQCGLGEIANKFATTELDYMDSHSKAKVYANEEF